MKHLLTTPVGLAILAFAVWVLFYSHEKPSSFDGGTTAGKGSSGSW